MVLEADRLNCVREVIVIAAALSIQDPRERPAEAQQAADESHRRFATDGSDFLAFVRLWDHLRERQHELGSSQFRKLCRAEYLNYLRVREWQDLYSQLRQIAGSLGIRLAAHPRAGDFEPAARVETSHPDRVHQALMAGLLSHIGLRDGNIARLSRRARLDVRDRPRIGGRQAVATLDHGGRAGRDQPAVGAHRDQHPTRVGRAHRRPPGHAVRTANRDGTAVAAARSPPSG